MSARNVIYAALHDNGWRAFADPTADAILAALSDAGYVILTAAQDASLTAEMERRGHEIASLRVTLGQMPPSGGAEPIGCPVPGACSAVAAVAALVAAEREACALIADDVCDPFSADDGFSARAIAAAIRARGTSRDD